MASQIQSISPFADDQPRSDRIRRWLWFVFSLFGNATITCFSLPFRLGKPDFEMAVRLFQVDENPRRKWSVCLSYMTLSLLKAQTAALLLVVSVFIVPIIAGWQIPAIAMDGFWGLMIALLLAMSFAALLAVATTLFAWWHSCRIWIDIWPEPRIALDGRCPPVSDTRNNGAFWVTFWPVALAAGAAAIATQNQNQVFFVVAIATAAAPGLWIMHKVIADLPEECYSENRESIDDKRLDQV